MSDLNLQSNLGTNPQFMARVLAAALNAAQAVTAEVGNDSQVLTATGATAGTFTTTSVPASNNATIVLNGTTTNASASITGLASTNDLFVGQAISGAGIPVGATVATITSTSAITISANATASATVALTFSGSPNVVFQWNATAGDVAALLASQPGIGPANVTATGGPLNTTPITVTFCGTLGNQPLKLMSVAINNLTGATPTITRGTVGIAFASHAQRQAFVSAFVRGSGTYITMMSILVAGNAAVQADFNASGAPATVTQTVQNGTLTNGSAVVTSIPSTANLLKNQPVSGTGVPAAAIIASIDSATQVTLSANATATGTQSLTFAAFTQTEAAIANDISFVVNGLWNTFALNS